MNIYEREAIGNIVIIKNIIFQNTATNKKEIDHAWKSGRPCLIIFSDDNYDYILPITSTTKNPFAGHHFALTKECFLHTNINRHNNYNNKKNKNKEITGTVNLQNIYKVPISFHDEIGKITFDTYKSIITKLKNQHKKEALEEIINKAKTVGGR